MKVEHIVWQDYHRGDVKGILELEIYHHGDDEPTRSEEHTSELQSH